MRQAAPSVDCDPTDRSDVGLLSRICPAQLGRPAAGLAATVAVAAALSPSALAQPMQAITAPLEHAVTTGVQTLERDLPAENLVIPGWQVSYETLNPAQKKAAVHRGEGLSVAEPSSTGDAAGTEIQEPMTLKYVGNLAALQKALESQGWHSPYYPVSTQYLNGHPQDLALTKNENLARDHLRVYSLGTDPATGQPAWGIFPTRDVAGSVTTPGDGHGFEFGHNVDPQIGRERDQVMHDILKAWPRISSTWMAVHGNPAPHASHAYQQDSLVYVFAQPPQ
ncbi:MAG TPA: LssY C-terminal domain-containing protein [Candidatus Xenobia bacterium]